MEQIFLRLMELLSTVTALKFIDLDKKQLEFYTTRPAVAFPCALIKVEIVRAENQNAKNQIHTYKNVIRLGFDYTGETTATTPADILAESLVFFRVQKEVYEKLQGQQCGSGKLSLGSATEETRADGLKVLVMPFSTTDFSSVP